MDWSRGTDVEIKRILLDLWKDECDAITDGTGKWQGVQLEERHGALMGVSNVMRRIMDSIDGKEAEG